MGEPYWADGDVTLHLGDCLDVLRTMEPDSIDAIVTDPPYELTAGKKGGTGAASLNVNSPAGRSRISTGGGGFMGRSWDATGVPFDPETWRAAYRVLKPGGYLLAFGGTRTWHRMVCAIEDAGFEIRDSIDWIYGTGFPKNEACLKPAHEPIVMARKPSGRSDPLPGLGACMVVHAGVADLEASKAKNPGRDDLFTSDTYGTDRPQQSVNNEGRWPPNVLISHLPDCREAGTQAIRSDGHHPASRGHGGLSTSGHTGQEGLAERKSGLEVVAAWDCSPGCPVAELDRQSGTSKSSGGANGGKLGVRVYGKFENEVIGQNAGGLGDSGGASRYFPVFKYQAKAPVHERPRLEDGSAHETVKPLGLIIWLVKLVTQPGGTVLDMFAGSGPVGEACIVEGFSCILIDQDPKSAKLIVKRLSKPIQPLMFGMEDSAPAAPVRPVAALRPKPAPEVHPSLFDDLESA